VGKKKTMETILLKFLNDPWANANFNVIMMMNDKKLKASLRPKVRDITDSILGMDKQELNEVVGLSAALRLKAMIAEKEGYKFGY